MEAVVQPREALLRAQAQERTGALRPESKYKKPQSQYSLYQECVELRNRPQHPRLIGTERRRRRR
eukprot:439412-Rhodomonas_salina.1